MLIAIVHNWVICQFYCSQTIKLSVRTIAEVATDTERTESDSDLTVFSRIRIGSESSFIRRCGSESEFGFALPNSLGTISALHSAKTFLFFGLHLNFGKKMPQFSVKTFIFFWASPKVWHKKRPYF